MGSLAAAAQEKEGEQATEEETRRETATGGGACASPVGEALQSSSSSGLGHHGEPDELEENRGEGNPGEDMEVRIGPGTVHVAFVAEEVGGAPEQLDPSLVLELEGMVTHRIEVIERLSPKIDMSRPLHR